MVGTVLANVGLTGQIADGVDGWGSAMNLNMLLVDALISQKALSNTITTPPASPALGDVYIVPTGATGTWSAAVGKVAVWNGTTWVFITPKNGWHFYIVSSGDYYRYSGSAWVLNTSQPLNANLTAYAGLTLAADKGVYATGAEALSTYTLTGFGRSMAGAADAGATRALLSLGTAAVVNTGTSGNTIPLLSQSNIWSGVQTHSNAAVIMQTNSDTASTAPQMTYQRSGGTSGSPTAVQSGQLLFSMFIAGHQGSTFANTALITATATENYTSTTLGSKISFATILTGQSARVDRWSIDGIAALTAEADNAYNICSAAKRAKEFFCANGVINTSDAREKTAVTKFTTTELECAFAVAQEIGWFKWLEEVEKKGDAARKHTGLTVQRAIEVMESYDMDPFEHGFICYDKWDAEYQIDEAGETRCTLEAGDRYSFRDGELMKFIAAGIIANQAKVQSDIEQMKSDIQLLKAS